MIIESDFNVGDKVVIKCIAETGTVITVIRVNEPQFNYIIKPDNKNYTMGPYYEDELQSIDDTFIPDDGTPVLEGEDE